MLCPRQPGRGGGRPAVRRGGDRRFRAVLLRAERPAAGRLGDRRRLHARLRGRSGGARGRLLRLAAPLPREFLEPGIPGSPERRACARIRGPGEPGAGAPPRLSATLTGAAPVDGPGAGLSFRLGSGRLDVVTPRMPARRSGSVEADPAEAGFVGLCGPDRRRRPPGPAARRGRDPVPDDRAAARRPGERRRRGRDRLRARLKGFAPAAIRATSLAMNDVTPRQATVTVGSVRFGNALPLRLIAGPCAMESRDHALEMASALKEMAARLGIGLVYKSSFDKANRTSASSARGIGLDKRAVDLRRGQGEARPARPHRRARERPMRARRRGRRRPADPGLPVPPDRPPRRGGQDRPGRQRQEGPVPGALGHGERRRQGHGRRQPERDGHRARRVLRLQHPRVGHALPADHGRDDRRAGDLRRHPFGAAARRPGRRPPAASGSSSRSSPAPRSRSASPGVFIETHQDPDRAPSDGPNMVPAAGDGGAARAAARPSTPSPRPAERAPREPSRRRGPCRAGCGVASSAARPLENREGYARASGILRCHRPRAASSDPGARAASRPPSRAAPSSRWSRIIARDLATPASRPSRCSPPPSRSPTPSSSRSSARSATRSARSGS